MNMSTDGKKARGKGADFPAWWLQKVREIVDERKADSGESLTDLGVLLGEAVGRPKWDHSTVSRFLNEENTTIEMAEAFSALFGIPRPLFMPRSLDEALSLQQVYRRYDARAVNPEQARRRATQDEVLASEEERVRDQTQGVRSEDEGTPRRGRTGRATRGRSSTS